MKIEKFKSAGKEATLYRSSEAGRPLIILNTYDGDGKAVIEEAEKPEGMMGAPAGMPAPVVIRKKKSSVFCSVSNSSTGRS